MTVTTELVLTRHGEANNNATGTVGGERGCTGLSPRGRTQIQRLAHRLAAEHQQRPFNAFYGTPRRRVRESIDIITEALPVAVTIVEDLRGPDHGDADGRPWHDIKTTFGGPPQHNPTSHTPPTPKPGTNTSTGRPAHYDRSSTGTPDNAS